MSHEPTVNPGAHRVLPRWVRPVLILLVAVLFAVLLARTLGLETAVQAVVERLRAFGALAFFVAMALLPAAGFPLLPFALAAGPSYSPQLGVAGVIGCACVAVAVNVALSYLLAARVLRGPVQAMVGRWGGRLPDPSGLNPWLLTLIVRVAPGPPFWLQSYALGLLRVRFAAYLTVSTLVPAGYLSAAILLGDAWLHGRPRQALLAAGVIGIVAAFVVLARRRLAIVRPPGR